MPKRTPPRRPKRPQGSVYWHTASSRWCAQTPPDRNGRRRSKYFPENQEQTAWDWLSEQVDAIAAGADVATGAERLSEYLTRWLARESANPNRDWSASTTRTYTWAIDRISAHRLARTPVGDLTREHTDAILADFAEEMKRRSVTLVRSLLRSTLADLADDGIISRVPVRRARTARHLIAPDTDHCPWTEADTRKFLAAARVHSNRPALWWLITSCGLRSDEARSLMLSDLDLANGTLSVWRSKTRRRQTLDLPTNVIDALRDHLRQRRSLGGRLFQARPGFKMGDATIRAELQRLRAQAGVPPIQRVHDLRHVAGSLMLANGYPVPAVAEILGHSPKTLLTTYAHAIPKHVIQAPRNIAQVLPWLPDEPPSRLLGEPVTAAKPDRPAVHSAVPSALLPSRSKLDPLLADR